MDLFADSWHEINLQLNKCMSGIEEIQKHEVSLLDHSLLRVDPLPDWSLLELETTLLHLGGLKDVSKGVFYALAIPAAEEGENIIVR